MSDGYYAMEYWSTLSHHGTKGQQWGRRRYQNADGSLTPLGREHYGVGPARKAMNSVKTAIRRKFKPTSAELKAQIREQQKKNDIKAQKRELKRLKKTGVNEGTKDPDQKADRGQHKRFSEMSDAEINARITRLTNEIKLADLERTKNMGPTGRMVDRAIRAGLQKGLTDIIGTSTTKLGMKVVDGLLDSSKNSQNKKADKKEEPKSWREERVDKRLAKVDKQLDVAKKELSIEEKKETIQSLREKKKAKQKK